MAHIAIYTTSMVRPTPTDTGFRISGTAKVEGSSSLIEWASAEISWTATAATVNTAIEDAAVAAAADAGFTVGGGDTKRIIGGAV